MWSFWKRYRPFLSAGIQELITYRVNFFLYRIGDVMGLLWLITSGRLFLIRLSNP